ncbi:UNVERIFIED_CONTAM: hypothetical protein Cloal_2102 [Acetivibrio alkalicellulosi]
MLMIKVICGKKGVGKTKVLVDLANSLVDTSLGDVVFIDGSSQLMYDLNHKIRFINLSEFPVNISGSCTFLGFICGVISENYDISGIFIDNITKVANEETNVLKELIDGLKELSTKYSVDFYISLEGDPNSMPDFIKECY